MVLSYLLGLNHGTCYVLNKWVPKYPGPEFHPFSPLLSISRKNTSILRSLAVAVAAGRRKKGILIETLFYVSTKPIAEGSQEWTMLAGLT